MPRKSTLYIDIDDTIVAQVLPGSGFDLRPCMISQLKVLGRMYDCCWLTMWPYKEPIRAGSYQDGMSIVSMMSCLYGAQINETFRYGEWDRDHDLGKAEFVLRESAPKDWYWLEDPLHKCESDALATAGQLDRYICVEPQGPWGFLDAVNELFRRSGKSASDIARVGGRPEWFDKAVIAAGKSGEGQLVTKPSEPRDLAQAHSEFLQSGIEIRDALGATAEADEPDRIPQDGCRTGSGQEEPA
jgi:hypothetical protein